MMLASIQSTLSLIGLSWTVRLNVRPITWQCVPSSVCSDDDIKLQLIDRMRLWPHLHSPAHLCTGGQTGKQGHRLMVGLRC